MNMSELKPCPFCGRDDDLHVTVHEVMCGNCGASVGSMCKTKEINIDIWNNRISNREE
jgi:NMD protein affecting ribosome stability and mRNA decay